MMSLDSEKLLVHYYMEAGVGFYEDKPEKMYWGAHSPYTQVRGHFTGHWLSAAAKIYAAEGDMEIKAKADKMVSELGRCQEENGGEWIAPIPEKYLHRIASGKPMWAPQYVVHKTLMGLWDMYEFAGNQQALDILMNSAKWFHRWSGKFTREEMDDILDFETGGMLEIWANLYGLTGKQEHLDLVSRYDRRRLFDKLLKGEDVLTNKHANTTIPEAIGAARAWEVTGNTRWRQVVEAYWDQAVRKRGTFCTGGQNYGEIWTPPFEFSARLGPMNQEHCTVYNMMRLAEYLLRWTGEAEYADYWERNLYNGVLAQQNKETGMISYFLPLGPGSVKKWGTPTDTFWCCHGTMVQAHSYVRNCAYYEFSDGLAICQYIPTELDWEYAGHKINIHQEFDNQTECVRKPDNIAVRIKVKCDEASEFSIKIRIPWWVSSKPEILINGNALSVDTEAGSFYTIRRVWKDDEIYIVLPKRLHFCHLPDRSDMAAFMDGPLVLAGLCCEENTLYGDISSPDSFLTPDRQREWNNWITAYRTKGTDRGIRFIPINEICDETYTVYFPIQNK